MSELSVATATKADPKKLLPFDGNPRKITARMFAALKRSIRDHGFVEPVVVQRSSMRVIGGHQRLKALAEVCKEMGAPLPRSVPAVLLDVDDRRARLLNVALNKIDGEWDDALLAEWFTVVQDDALLTPEETLSIGFTEDEISKLLTAPADPDLNPFASSVTLSLQFDNVEERDTVKAALKELCADLGLKSGTAVHRLLKQVDAGKLLGAGGNGKGRKSPGTG